MKPKRGFYDVFVRACAKYPSNVAVRLYEDGEYKCFTYSELYGVCEYLSQQLQLLQNNCRGPIGLVSRTNIIVPCVIAASHKYCSAFMFLDPSAKNDSLIEEMKFAVIISILENCEDVESMLYRKPDKKIVMFDMMICFYNCVSQNPQLGHSLDHSFIAMTSGSTGIPKKIKVPMQCIQPNIDDLTNMFHITSEDTIYFSTPLTFDPSMVEVLLAFKNGAALLIAPQSVDALFPSNRQHAVTVWQTTPSKFFQFPNAHIKNKILSAKSPLKILALGGEPINGVRRLKELKDSNNKTKIFSLYGVTEMSCWASVAELELNKIATDREVPLGQCLSETKVILEPESNTTSIGKIILVSKSRKCVILNNGEEENSLRFIDTGDLGEASSSGTIYYRGRKDDIIKRFGNKVNLQFIESTVMHCPRVNSCSCIWLPKPQLLVLYFTSESISSQDLSDFLKCKLDDKHWPDRIVRVDNMPINQHGKISKALLAKMMGKISNASTMSLYQLKARFLQEVKSALNTKFTYDQIKDKTFSKLGGTSFAAVALCNNISVTNPEFGKFLLPHLMTERKSIDQILDLAEKEVLSVEAKPKKRLRIQKQKSDTISTTTESEPNFPVAESSHSKLGPIEFVEMWTYNTGKCVDASPSLLKTGLNLYVTVGSHSGKVVTVDAMTGFVVGTINMKSRIEASVCCCSKDPVLPPCGIVGSYDGSVVCYTIETSEVIWKTDIGTMIKSKAAVRNRCVYVASYDGFIRGLDLATGKVRHSIFIADQPISADLVIAKNEYILTGTLSGVCASIHTESNTVAWRGTLDSPVFASPALYDDDKYVVFAEVSGEIHCRTVEKGIKIWKYSEAKGNIFSSIHIREVEKTKYQMVFGCHDNHIYSIIVKNYQPSLQWKIPMNSAVYSTPCGITDKLILAASNEGKLIVISAEHGVILAEYNLPKETFSSPAVYRDYIFIGCRNDLLYALKFVLNA